jgi:hypothetical protein
VCAALVAAGCAAPAPSSRLTQVPSLVEYGTFVDKWMAGLPRKLYGRADPRVPSDTRIVVLDAQTPVEQRVRELNTEFSRWCRSSYGVTSALRSEDMQTPGTSIAVCEAPSGRKYGAFQAELDPEATKQGRRQLLLKHWYDGAMQAYLGYYHDVTERLAAERDERRRQEQARAVAASAAAEKERAQARQAAAQLPLVLGCRNFERQSNALRARFDAQFDRDSLARYLSDLVVALDECVNARPAPSGQLSAVYRFNVASFQVFQRAWQEGVFPCGESGECQANTPMHQGQVQRIARLQAEFSAIDAPVPAHPIGLVDRVVRFVVDR